MERSPQHLPQWRSFQVPCDLEVVRRQVEGAVNELCSSHDMSRTAVSIAATGHRSTLSQFLRGRQALSAEKLLVLVAEIDRLWASRLTELDQSDHTPPTPNTAPPERGSGVAAPAPAVEPVGETCLTLGDGALGERIGCTSDGRARHVFQSDRETANGE